MLIQSLQVEAALSSFFPGSSPSSWDSRDAISEARSAAKHPVFDGKSGVEVTRSEEAGFDVTTGVEASKQISFH